jgi:hypothetical protein
MSPMETMKDYCQNRLLIVGPARGLKQFDRDADRTEIPGATDLALLEHTPTRRSWQFVTEAPALKSLRDLSRRWPKLTFFLHYDCEERRLIGLVQAKHGRLRQHRYTY